MVLLEALGGMGNLPRETVSAFNLVKYQHDVDYPWYHQIAIVQGSRLEFDEDLVG